MFRHLAVVAILWGLPDTKKSHIIIIISLQYLEAGLLFAHPSSHTLCSSCSRTHPQPPATGWRSGMGWCYCAKIWNWAKLITIYYPGFPLEVASLQQTPELKNSYIRFCQWRFSLGGETDLWCFLLHNYLESTSESQQFWFFLSNIYHLYLAFLYFWND